MRNVFEIPKCPNCGCDKRIARDLGGSYDPIGYRRLDKISCPVCGRKEVYDLDDGRLAAIENEGDPLKNPLKRLEHEKGITVTEQEIADAEKLEIYEKIFSYMPVAIFNRYYTPDRPWLFVKVNGVFVPLFEIDKKDIDKYKKIFEKEN